LGIWAAVSKAARGVGIAEDFAEAEGEAEGVGVVEGDGDGEVVDSSVTVSVATGLFGAFALAGSSSSRETEHPALMPTTAVTASAAMTERYRVIGRVPGRVVGRVVDMASA
jgi:hypothetical protein